MKDQDKTPLVNGAASPSAKKKGGVSRLYYVLFAAVLYHVFLSEPVVPNDTTTSTATTTPLGLARNVTDPLPPEAKDHPAVLHDYAYDLETRLLVIPEYKLLFCYIEKVGCTMFNQLFRLLRLYHPSVTSPMEHKYLAGRLWARLKPSHYGLTLHNLTDLVNDEEWTKAVFFREPADRFLSGFKSKCGEADSDGKKHCFQAFGGENKKFPDLDGSANSFHKAITMAYEEKKKNGDYPANAHFRPAGHFCGGLMGSIDHYNFVHQLDKHTAPDHIRNLFHHLGVDKNLTEGLIERVVKTGGKLSKIDKANIKEKTGMRIIGEPEASHDTSHSKMSSKDYFKSPKWLRMLQEVYKEDYELFQLTPPKWKDLH